MSLSIETLPWFKGKLDCRTHFVGVSDKSFELDVSQKSCWSFIDYIVKAHTLVQLNSVCRSIASYYGYNHFGFAFLYPKSKDKFLCHHIFDEASEWVTHYQKNLIFVDPFTDHCIRQSTPLAWRSDEKCNKTLLEVSPQVGMAFSDFSVKNILSVPYHAMGGMSGCFRLVRFNDTVLAKADIQFGVAELHLLTSYLMEAARRILCSYPVKPNKSAIHLTVREHQVLSQIAKGYSAYVIALNMKISENTVLTHTKNIYRKLGVNNRQIAVTRAVALGLAEL